MKLHFFVLTVGLFLISCSQPRESQSKELQSLEVQDVFQISSSSVELPGDLILGSPFLTVTDNQGGFYTFDPTQNLIFRFDSDGNFKTVMGGKGKGPGELESVYGMVVLDEGQLLVYDYMQQRSTIFGANGEVQRIMDMDFQGKAVSSVRKIDKDELLLTVSRDGFLAHIFDLTDEEVKKSAMKTDDLLQTENKYESVFLESFSGTALPISANRIVYTPQYYNGELDVYERNGEEWKFRKKMKGYQKIDKAFTIHESKSDPPETASSFSVHPDMRGYLGLEYHSESLGLFTLKDDKFAHISFRETDPEKKELKMVYEIFDAEAGKLEKAGEVDTLATTHPPKRMLVWVDEDGHLYMVEKPENPTLRKIEVLWEN